MGQLRAAKTTGKISEVVDSDGENKIDNHFKDSMVILKELERITNTFSTDWSVYSDSNWYFFWRMINNEYTWSLVSRIKSSSQLNLSPKLDNCGDPFLYYRYFKTYFKICQVHIGRFFVSLQSVILNALKPSKRIGLLKFLQIFNYTF